MQTFSFMKRLLDVVLGAALAMLAIPLIGLMALLVGFSMRTWPFFVHERLGKGGSPIRVWKLRTLPRTAPMYTDKHSLSDVSISRLGRFLRGSHLDELPQLFLVLRGRMSLVGPRPEMEFLHRQGDPRFGSDRVAVAPGCTGLWQISEGYAGLIWDSPDYDRFYLQHATVRLDLWIIWRTVLMTARLAGPVTLQRVPNWTLAHSERVKEAGIA